MTRNLEARLSTYSPTALAVYRVVFGLLWLCQGLSKVIGWPKGPAAPVGEYPGFYAGWIELVTGVLITIGLFTRIAAFVACGEMAVAYFTVHLPHGFFPITNGGEPAVMYCFAFFLLIFLGAGAYALDTRRPAAGLGWRGRRAAPRGSATGAGRRGTRAGPRWARRRRNRQPRTRY
jgi:putative oxidoreductase